MRTVNFLQNTTGTFSLPCPAGKRIRILAFDADLTGVNPGEEMTFLIRRPPTPILIFSGPPMTAAIAHIGCAIGLHNTAPRQSIVDPVTGVIAYDATMVFMSMALPDCWWPFEITLEVSGAVGATCTLARLTYETEGASVGSRARARA